MRTVFVIDDDQLMREVLSRVLEKSGYRVRAFPSPLQALPLMDSAYPDAVVSDVQMPGMSGVDLAREIRDRGIAVPVVLVTANPSADLETRARDLGVSDIFDKPIRNTSQLAAAVDLAVSRREEEDGKAGLDRLRLSFLTGLAHELRTPLTAIKLALDNLFAARKADRLPADGAQSTESRLLAIGQRNLDRIIRLVEGQLDLLQITLGDVSVSRRLVSIRDLVERAVADTQPAVRKRIELGPRASDDRIFVFTDPDRLRAVIRYLLDGGAADENRPMEVVFGLADGGRKVEIGLQNLNGRNGETSETFESRAFHRIVASLGGEIRRSATAPEAEMTLVLPVLPRFDRREDFTSPMTGLREAAMLSGRAVSALKCVVAGPARTGSCFSREESEFFQRAAAVLSEGDALVRANAEGVYYLIVVERDHDEIVHITNFLGNRGEPAAEAEELAEVAVGEIAMGSISTEESGRDLRAVVEDVEPVL
jgi:two-component system response regulator FixJ